MRKSFLTLALGVLLYLSFPLTSAMADTVQVNTEAGLSTAISEVTAGTERTIELTDDIELTVALSVNKQGNVTICSTAGQNYTLTAAAGARHFTTGTSTGIIYGGSSLTLENVTLDGAGQGGGIQYHQLIRSGSGTYTLTLGEGAVVENCVVGGTTSSYTAAYNEGGGVSVNTTSPSSGEFFVINIDGATIRNNTSARYSSTASLINWYGGGGVYVSGAVQLNMSSGSIEGNTGQNGGGVKLYSGATMTMTGGTIKKNQVSRYYGAGVLVEGSGTYAATFNFEGGVIEENASAASAYALGDGGGVMVYGDRAVMTMTDGTIQNNGGWWTSADREERVLDKSRYLGGGVCLWRGGTFTMTGGVIQGNQANLGGGVCLGGYSAKDEITMVMDGDSLITKNVADEGTGSNTDGGGGGGIGTHNSPYASLTMKGNSSITYNTALSTGGGVYLGCSDNTTALFTMEGNSSIHDNQVTSAGSSGVGQGGGVYTTAPMVMKDASSIYNNEVAKGEKLVNDYQDAGGGVHVATEGFLTMQDTSSIYGNWALNGGGVCVTNRGDMLMQGTASIHDNEAGLRGGGIIVEFDASYVDTPSTLTAEDGTFIINNKAGSNGGGVYMKCTDTTTETIHFTTTGTVTITGNTAPDGDGGGIWCYPPVWNDVLTLSNETVFANNSAQNYCLPPADYDTAYPNIGFASITLPDLARVHPLNNYDINFTNEEEFQILYWQYGEKFDYWDDDVAIPVIISVDDGEVALPGADDMDLPEHYAFLGWYDNPDLTGDPITVVALDPDNLADINVYAKLVVTIPVAFEVENGAWSDGGVDRIAVDVPLYDEDGKPSIDGTGDITAFVPTGMVPNQGYTGGSWDPELPADGKVTYDPQNELVFVYAFVPEPAPETGDLSVSKVVTGDGADLSKEFSFTVTLDDDSVAGDYGDLHFDGGVAEFTLKHGETKTATGLPAGVEYEVVEDDYSADGYTALGVNDSGAIAKGATAAVSFTNTYAAAPAPGTGDLSVSKTVSGDGADQSREFSFTVTLDDDSVAGDYGDLHFDGGVAEFTLKHGETRVATGLPVDVGYTVVEDDYSDEGYETTSSGDAGTVEEDETAVVQFVNHKDGEGEPDPGPTDPDPDDPDEPDDPDPDPEPVDPEPSDPDPVDPEPSDPTPTNPEPSSPEPDDEPADATPNVAKPAGDDADVDTESSKALATPKTGDAANVLLWAALALVAVVVAAVACAKRARR